MTLWQAVRFVICVGAFSLALLADVLIKIALALLLLWCVS